MRNVPDRDELRRRRALAWVLLESPAVGAGIFRAETRLPVGVGVVALVLAFAGCSAQGAGIKEGRKPMGSLPSASTTATPEWLPWRPTAGTSVAPDSRESRLTELRRITQGWSVRHVAWSLDGGHVVVVATRPDEQESIFRVPTGAGPVVRVGEPMPGIRGVAVVGTEQTDRIVVATGGAPGLLVIDGPGSARPVKAVPFSVESIAPGPQGRLLVVSGERPPRLYDVDPAADPSRLQPLIAVDVAPIAPALSPDRAYVAFGRRASARGAGSLGLTSIEGRNPREMASFSGSIRSLSFHPSGRSLVFSSDHDASSFELYTMQIDPTSFAQPGRQSDGRVSRLTYGQGDVAAFAPDGRSIAFTSTRGGSTPDLYIARFVEEP